MAERRSTTTTRGEPPVRPATTEHGILDRLDGLLAELETESSVSVRSPRAEPLDNQLAAVRLGVASSLFRALRCKHAPTARHSLRVALTCSAWSTYLGLDEELRDEIEVAALLHDVGMIGLPDKVMHKEGRVTGPEIDAILRARRMSVDIIQGACNNAHVLEMVEHVGAWYDGSRRGYVDSGRSIPLGARMIAIAEAFDAMTTTSVYRAVMTHERAIAELYAFASTQFDPELVEQFDRFYRAKRLSTCSDVAKRWLSSLEPDSINAIWELHSSAVPPSSEAPEHSFHEKMLDDMQDAVIFLDSDRRVTRWNRATERLTGTQAESTLHRRHLCELLELRDDKDVQLTPRMCDECPIGCAVAAGVGQVRRLTLRGRKQEEVPVNCHAIPVNDESGNRSGAIVILRDASHQISWEARCQTLLEQSKLDPLTQLANRAEFDRVCPTFVQTHRTQDMPCSMIMCDIDHFKHINDTFGHQAGDDVIRSTSGMLRKAGRTGDIVARYGGEEFVILCADCTAGEAMSRAERVRAALEEVTHTALGGNAITASFGVTELQPGDTPETFLRRADRGLLTAKSKGRNTVVQVGCGRMPATNGEPLPANGDKPKGRADTALAQHVRVTAPKDVVFERLREFVADHRARLIRADNDMERVWLGVSHGYSASRRRSDRPVEFRILLDFTANGESELKAENRVTHFQVTLAAVPGRNRRRTDQHEHARELLASLRSYLTAAPTEPARFTNLPELPQEHRFLSWLRGMGEIGRRVDDG